MSKGNIIYANVRARQPAFEARMIQRLARSSKTGGMYRFIIKDDPAALRAADATDAAMDTIVDHWQRLIDANDEPALIKRLDAYYAAQTRSEEDDLMARADEIRARRAAEDVLKAP